MSNNFANEQFKKAKLNIAIDNILNEPMSITRLKAKPIRLAVERVKGFSSDDAYFDTILKCSANATIMTLDHNAEGLPSLQKIRDTLEPAYDVITKFLRLFLKNNTIQSKDLSQLDLKVFPTYGYFKFSVTYTYSNDNKIFKQPYNFTISNKRIKSIPSYVINTDLTNVFDILDTL